MLLMILPYCLYHKIHDDVGFLQIVTYGTAKVQRCVSNFVDDYNNL